MQVPRVAPVIVTFEKLLFATLSIDVDATEPALITIPTTEPPAPSLEKPVTIALLTTCRLVPVAVSPEAIVMRLTVPVVFTDRLVNVLSLTVCELNEPAERLM